MRLLRSREARIIHFLVVAALALAVVSCSDDDDPVAPAAGVVIFHFDQEVGLDNPLVIESSTTNFPYTNAAGNPYNVSELKYFVSNFRVHNMGGTVFGVDDYLFRDAEDPSTRNYWLGGVPAGTYNAISFTFGLDAKTNVSGALPILEILWPENWGGGYHYMEMNGNYQDSGTSYPYRTHTGRRFIANAGDPSGEGPDSVAHHHFFEVYLPVKPFTITGGDTWDVTAVMDVNGWYENPLYDHRTYFPLGQGNVMTDLDAQAILMENGMNNVYRVKDPTKR